MATMYSTLCKMSTAFLAAVLGRIPVAPRKMARRIGLLPAHALHRGAMAGMEILEPPRGATRPGGIIIQPLSPPVHVQPLR